MEMGRGEGGMEGGREMEERWEGGKGRIGGVGSGERGE